MYRLNIALENGEFLDKIGCIKAVRGLSGFGLREAKDFVESLPGVITVSENIKPIDINDWKERGRSGGLRITAIDFNSPIRKEIKEQLNATIAYANLASQYDISRELMDILENYFPQLHDENEE